MLCSYLRGFVWVVAAAAVAHIELPVRIVDHMVVVDHTAVADHIVAAGHIAVHVVGDAQMCVRPAGYFSFIFLNYQ